MKTPFCIKICKKCGKLLVANTINFHKKKNGKYGLRADCKECYLRYAKGYYQENKEEKKIYSKEHCKDYYKDNIEKMKEYNKKYYQDNKEKRKQDRKEYYQNNKEKCRECTKQWEMNNPDKIFNICQRRRLKEENQGNGISKEQWIEIMNFFNWECAYSGIQLNKDNRSLDHIIPLNRNGENEIWNLIPMYLPYNSSKKDNEMLDWYTQQPFFNEDRLGKIYEWIEYAKDKYKK